MSNILKTVLIVGLGSIGKRHLRILREISTDLNLVVLRRPESILNDEPDADHIVTSLKDAIAHKPQAAIICNPSSQHLEISIALANEGVNLLIEKPISNSSKDIKILLDIANKNNLRIMVGYNLRFLDSLKFFKAEIEKNTLGDLFSVRAEVGQNLELWRPQTDYKKGSSARRSLGGGVLLELSHEIDYLHWIFGPIEWTFGFVDKVSNLEIDVEDISHVLMKFKDSKNYSNLVANLTLDFLSQDTRRSCLITAEKGSIQWDGIKSQVNIYRNGQWNCIFDSHNETDYSYKNELVHFIDCVENNKKPLISVNSSSEVIDIVESIKISSKTNRTVKVIYNH
jgi:predicted dehydrogenase